MKFASNDDDLLWVYSMRKRFQVRCITTSDEEANAFMESHPDTGLIAQYGPFRIIANLYAGVQGIKDPPL